MPTERLEDVDDKRLQRTVARYEAEELTLAEAAAEVGVSKLTMRLYLADQDVELRICPESIEEIQAGVEAMRSDE
jgi:response regulator of citrate/malate metabolism